MVREARIMLLSGESLFMGGSDYVTVTNQRTGTVVIICRNTKNVQNRPLKQGVDEWCHSRVLRSDEQECEQYHDKDNGKEPIFFPLFEEGNKFLDEFH